MAFVQKTGSRYAVKHGTTGQTLRTFASKDDAEEEMRRLHRIHMPKPANRGVNARKRVTGR